MHVYIRSGRTSAPAPRTYPFASRQIRDEWVENWNKLGRKDVPETRRIERFDWAITMIEQVCMSKGNGLTFMEQAIFA